MAMPEGEGVGSERDSPTGLPSAVRPQWYRVETSRRPAPLAASRERHQWQICRGGLYIESAGDFPRSAGPTGRGTRMRLPGGRDRGQDSGR